MTNEYLKPLYNKENPLQAINRTVEEIEDKTGISVVRCHVGSPYGPQYEGTNELMARYYQWRSKYPETYGYADVAGPPYIRKALAQILCRFNRLPEGSIDEKNVFGVTGGTGALNVALSIFKDATILAPEPFYPPWGSITERTQGTFDTFPLRKEDNRLLNEGILSEKISKTPTDKPVVLLYHYPHNPTGKALTQDEAKQVGETLNKLCKTFPNLYLLQEDIYLATTDPKLGLYTPLPYLNDETKKRTIWLNSPSKMGHPQDRGAIIAAFDKTILHHLRGALSFSMLGGSMPALLATANTLAHIAQGGIDPIGAPGSRPNNHRYVTAKYYRERLKIVYDALKKIGDVTGSNVVDEMPQGTYYLFPSFECLKGQPIPAELRSVFDAGKEVFENANDVVKALANAHLIGLRPLTVAPGTLFVSDKGTMSIRLATVEQDLQKLNEAGNTLKGLVQKTLGKELGATFLSREKLQEKYPAQSQIISQSTSKEPIPFELKWGVDGIEWVLKPFKQPFSPRPSPAQR